MSFVQIELSGKGLLAEELDNFTKETIRNYEFKEAELKIVAEVIREGIQENVLNSESIHGGQVAPDSPATVKFKGFQRPLYHTGGLSRSIMKRKISGGYEVYVSSKKSLSGLPYSEVAYNLQYGWKGTANLVKPIGKKKYTKTSVNIKTPPRPFFGISEKIDNDIDTTLNNIFKK